MENVAGLNGAAGPHSPSSPARRARRTPHLGRSRTGELAPKRYFFREGLNPGKPALAGQWFSGLEKYTYIGQLERGE